LAELNKLNKFTSLPKYSVLDLLDTLLLSQHKSDQALEIYRKLFNDVALRYENYGIN
jgi:hypothetical protein